MNDPKRLLVVFLALIFIGGLCFGIKGYMDSDGYKKQVNYTTAVQTTKQDDFNYIVDSQQGRVLVNGNFTTKPENAAKFDEMSQGFSYVKRAKEHYTMHEYTTCTKNSCTTHIYYSWDEVSSDVKYASKLSFMGRDYTPTLFNFHNYVHDTNACAFTSAGTGTGLFEEKKGCIDGNFYLNDDDRYVYSTAPLSFNATFLATTYGGLKPFQEDQITLQNKSISEVLKDSGKYKLYSFWTLLVILVILTGVAIYLGYEWVFEDGVWSTSY